METKIKTKVTVIAQKKESPTKKDLSSSSSSDSSSDEEPDTKKATTKTTESIKTAKKAAASSSSSGSSSDSSSASDSDSDTKMVTDKPAPKAPSPAKIVADDGQVTKKRRTNEQGNSVATAYTANVENESVPARNKGGKGKPGRQVNERFKRVDPGKFEPIQDNGYIAKVCLNGGNSLNKSMTSFFFLKLGPQNDYGKRAHEDLIVTRGSGFRKEKNKKKRGSYRGGEITVRVDCAIFQDAHAQLNFLHRWRATASSSSFTPYASLSLPSRNLQDIK